MAVTGLTVYIRNLEGQFEGRVSSIERDEGGATIVVAFPSSSAPRLPIRKWTELQICAEFMSQPYDARGRVIFRSDDAFSHRYHFRLDEHAITALSSALNRRAVQVRPDAKTSIEVVLRTMSGKECVPAVLNNVSGSGISVVFSWKGEKTLYSSRQLRIDFRLPPDGQSMDFVGYVRNRGLLGSAINYGIEFDPERTPNFAHKLEQIAAYVSQRETEMRAATPRRPDSGARRPDGAGISPRYRCA